MSEHRISIANDFSRYPGPRFVRQGPNSGEKFRKLLVRALKQHARVIVDLDGTRGYGSSFLDEAFAGLIKYERMSAEEVLQRVVIVSKEDDTYRQEILQALRDAKPLN